jgi:predicted CXXCH cytochrome family protein
MNLRCQIVMVTRNRKGQPVRSARLGSGDPITLGRSPESTVHLPDPRVPLHHALIRSNEAGEFYLEAREAPLVVNGESQSTTKLRPGARILVGPYEITPEPPSAADHDFALAIELAQPLTEGVNDLRDRSVIALDGTWLSKRAFSWAALILVGLVGLVLPLAFARSVQSREVVSAMLPGRLKAVAWNAAWDAGPLALGHQTIGNRCEACHMAPFERVPDAACTKCHVAAATPDHLGKKALDVGMKLGTRCAECHRDHRGPGALVRTDSSLCVNCHGDIKSLYPQTTLATISDFGNDHPPFALSMIDASTGKVARAIPGTPGFSGEASGLKFPHAKHLDKKGIRTPTGVRVIECAQCHKLDAVGARFEPIAMVGNCSECHRLEFEPAATKRQVPHGKPAEILTTLREFYSGVALGDAAIDVTLENDLLRRPTVEAGRVLRVNARSWADQKARAVAADLFERRLCVQCHQVSRDAAAGWVIAPVKITARWLPGAAFDHESHKQAPCEKCHAVSNSKTSADVAIPDLASCRTCHSGAAVVAGKVPSPCETCHSFHQHAKPGVRPPVSLAVAAPTPPISAESR